MYAGKHLQSVTALLPSEELLNAGHDKQVLAPMVVEYLPALHAMHVLVVEAPVVSEYFPTPQLTHDAVPVVVLYLPGKQAMHKPSGGPV
jgi:hypothetical protein